MAHILHAYTTSAPDPTFHPFPRLPAELRADIWAFAVSEEPTIPNSRLFTHIHHDGQVFYIRAPRISTLFFVNHEARYEVARIDGGAWYSLGVGNAKIYVNFEKDIAYLYNCCDRDSKVDKRFTRPDCWNKTWSHGNRGHPTPR